MSGAKYVIVFFMFLIQSLLAERVLELPGLARRTSWGILPCDSYPRGLLTQAAWRTTDQRSFCAACQYVLWNITPPRTGNGLRQLARGLF